LRRCIRSSKLPNRYTLQVVEQASQVVEQALQIVVKIGIHNTPDTVF